MLNNNKINLTNEKYQELLRSVSFAFPFHYLKDNTDLTPMLCEYGGNDEFVGVAFYYTLKKAYDENKKEIHLIYNKYAGHDLYHRDTPEGIEAMHQQHYKIMEFAKKYFTSD